MALQAPLPNFPIDSAMSGSMYPWTASINTEGLLKPILNCQSKSKVTKQKVLKQSVFSWLSQKTSIVYESLRPPVHKGPLQGQRFSDNISSQVDKIWSTIFVSCRCKSCWPPTEPVARLCTSGTYYEFEPDLLGFAKVYGSDGPKIFWEMILQDIQGYIVAANASGRACSENDMLVLSRLLDRVERQLERTTVSWGRMGPPQGSSRPRRYQTSIRRRVPAPPGRGFNGERVIDCALVNEVQDCRLTERQKTETVNININGRNRRMRKHPFDETYLGRKDVQASARLMKRRLNDSPEDALRRPSPLSQSITADDVQYPAFTQQQARWPLATLGKTSAYDSLSDCVVSVTKRYRWEGIARNQALSLIKRLQSRRDLLVRVDDGSETAGDEGTRTRPRKTTLEKRVLCLRAVLEKMAKEYDEGRRAFGCSVNGGIGADLGKIGRIAIPGLEDVKVLQGLVEELMNGRS